jgi:hypothetical protein
MYPVGCLKLHVNLATKTDRRKMNLAQRMKTISDLFNVKKEIEFENKHKNIVEQEYKNILDKIKEASDKGYYCIYHNPDFEDGAYQFLYKKLDKDGLKHGYVGEGSIAVWWR